MAIFWKPSERLELYHHGVKGQKWGVRRFQAYPDGRLGKKLKQKTDALGVTEYTSSGRNTALEDQRRLRRTAVRSHSMMFYGHA